MLAACRDEPERLSLDKLPASTRAPAPSSLLRFAREGGPARLYRVPSLEPSTWKAEDKLPPVEQVIGADAEQGLVFALDGKRNLVTLDLETRRVRTYLEQVRTATLGPDNALYAVDTGSTVTQMVRRAPIRFRNKLQGSPRQVYATMTGALLARVGDKAPVLEVLGSDRSPVSTTLPGEPIVAELLRRPDRRRHGHRSGAVPDAGTQPAQVDPPLGTPQGRAVLALGAPVVRGAGG